MPTVYLGIDLMGIMAKYSYSVSIVRRSMMQQMVVHPRGI
jgi:hypothetical protein